jgi:glycogen debranching enzyme
LSRYEWRVDGELPVPAGNAWTAQHRWDGYYITAPPELRRKKHSVDPQQQTIELHVSRRIGGGMHEDLELVNHAQMRTCFVLELGFDADFASQGGPFDEYPEKGRVERTWERVTGGCRVLLAYRAEHAYQHQDDAGVARFERALEVRVRSGGSAAKPHADGVRFELELAPNERWHAALSFRALAECVPKDAPDAPPSSGEDEWERRTSRFLESSAEFDNDGPPPLAEAALAIAAAAKRDLACLRLFDLDGADGWVPAAGAPGYIGLFGRDTVLAATQAALLGPELMRGTLERVANTRATRRDDWRDAQPGRLIHELHTDPASELRFTPHGRYYGDVTTSIAYPLLLLRHWRWTGDRGALAKFSAVARDALAWADRELLVEGVPFYRYQTRSEQGEHNQGWKDSDEAIVHADGTQARAPIGTCEMQGVVYAAKHALAEVLAVLGQQDEARALREQAEALKRRFNAEFWLADEHTFAMGLDAEGKLIRSVASGPAHCLAQGIVDEALAAPCVERLFEEDLFSGWGIRTLSARNPAYNPFAYHRGTLWPMESAELAVGCARYGFFDRLFAVCRATFELGSLYERARLPELVAGHPRDRAHPFPALYPEANAPQAWSAAAALRLFDGLLGLEPYAPRELLFVDPHLPEWLPDLTLERLRVGAATVSLRFERARDGTTAHEVLRQDGRLTVCRADRLGTRLQTSERPEEVALAAAGEQRAQ